MMGKKWMYRTGFSLTENRDHVEYGRADYKETLSGLHFKNVFSNQLNKKINIRLGADVFAKEYSSDFTEEEENHFGSYQDKSLAGFAEAEIYLSNKFVTRVGGRLEYSDYLQYSTASPRVSAAYKFGETSQLSLAYGWFYQDPLNNYLLYSNLIDPERADHYILTFQSIKNKRTLRSEFYYKDYKDLVKLNAEEFYLPEAYSNSGSGYAYGLDVFWRDNKTFRNGEYWISYGYTNTERDFRDYPFAAIPSFTSTHNLSVVYKHWFDDIRSLVGISYRFSSPRVYHDPNVAGFQNSKTICYNTLDVNISYLHRENIIFYAAITNLPGFKQEYGERYSPIPDNQGTYASEPIIPGANRFFVVACFITLSKRGDLNQLDKIE
jgi:outer membrane receptor for ferrienterochelin and colicin